MPRLTDKLIWECPAPDAGNKVYYDSPNARGRDWTPGFGLRVTAAGARSFILNYRTKGGIERRLTIGAPPAWSLSAARSEAHSLKRQVDSGGDPLGDLKANRDAPTVAHLCTRFVAEHLPSRRPSTRAGYGGIITRYIIPEIGNRTVVSIGYSDVSKLHRHITGEGGPYIANRAIAVLGKMFSLAIRWGMRTDNPVKGIERNLESKRTRYLTAEEMSRLSAVLREFEHTGVANVIRLLLLTGARKGEVLSARWADIDLVTGVWVKPAHTTKQKTAHRVPLSEAARRILADIYEMQGADQEWVFPGRVGHLHRIDNVWAVIRRRAGIPDVRLHDLRHTYASLLASAGQSLPIIGALLGHTNPTTTHRYAHLFDDPLRKATESVGAFVSRGSSRGRS
jgi:integrase